MYNEFPLVSVIIPSFNHAHYLPAAIDSVLTQTYQHFEILVVDDGSVDDTAVVVAGYPQLQYIYQPNSGLSAARNLGIAHSKGNFLVFLDADDWLHPNALFINLKYITQNPDAAFVAGAHEMVLEDVDQTRFVPNKTEQETYCHLLERNYIGMHAAVMFCRWVFNDFDYDTTLKSCEDYDLYLKITRRFEIINHNQLIAYYRKHLLNMSGNERVMLDSALLVLHRQETLLQNETEKNWYKKGLFFWPDYYAEQLQIKILGRVYRDNKILTVSLEQLRSMSEKRYIETLKSIRKHQLKNRIRQMIKPAKNQLIDIIRKLKQKIRQKPSKIRLGDFNRLTPISTQFGYDRGGPIDRYYIESFLSVNKALITGRVLEIGDNEYTLQFGGENVTKSDVFHVDHHHPKATYTGDLSNAPNLPANHFDCLIITQTLHLIYDFNGAVASCYRALKPGGTLLLTVPGISQIAQDEWGKHWFWSFTAASIGKVLSACFDSNQIKINNYGNVLAASSFLYGLGKPELTQKQLDYHDEHYQVIIAAAAKK